MRIIRIKDRNNQTIVINSDKILAIEPTRTSDNWNCCNILMVGGTTIGSSQSIDEVARLMVASGDYDAYDPKGLPMVEQE